MEMKCFMSRGKVLISGFLTNLDCPSEERLAVHVDLSGLAGYRHMEWVGELQDILRNVDTDYRKEKLGKEEKNGNQMLHRGRSVRVRYVKDGQGQQRKVASFQPYPSMIVNHFKELRRKVYDALNENCLILQEERIGRMKRKLYFLPANLASEIMNRVEELNNLLEALKIDVKEFEASQRFDAIKAHIKETGFQLNSQNTDMSAIKISPVPLSLSKDFFQQYLEEEKKKAVNEVDEKKTRTLTELEERRKRGLSALEKEVQRKREEMLDSLKHDLQEKFASTITLAEEAVKSILSGERSASKTAAKRYDKFIELVESVGVEYDAKPLRALSEVFCAAGAKDNNALTCAVSELATSLGIAATGDPARDIELAAKAARGESLMLFTIE
jgi:vacuolar-type H+-ATPase subunit H